LVTHKARKKSSKKPYKVGPNKDTMINFDDIRTELEEYDSFRDQIITIGRDVIKRSKLVIYALHRNEIENAKALVQELETVRAKLISKIKDTPGLAYEGSFKAATQEYVEAILYYQFVVNGELKDIPGIRSNQFILGMCDLPGELNRRAVYLAGKGKTEEVTKIRDIVEVIYGELLTLNARNNEMRRKIDSVKYELRKLEDLVLSLKLKR
jgi:translin